MASARYQLSDDFRIVETFGEPLANSDRII